MKKSIILFVFAALLLTSAPAIAQEATPNKFGHVNITELLEDMPAYKDAEVKLKNFAKQLQDALASMEQEYNQKLEAYYKLAQDQNTMPAILEVKQKEILDLEKRILGLQSSSEQQLLDKQVEVLAPIESDVMKAIKDLASEEGYTYIFDTSLGGSLLYYPESDDLSAKVKGKLGIQ